MRTQPVIFLISLIMLFACGTREISRTPSNEILPIVPKPVSSTVYKERVSLADGVTVMAASDDEERIKGLFEIFLKTQNISVGVVLPSTPTLIF